MTFWQPWSFSVREGSAINLWNRIRTRKKSHRHKESFLSLLLRSSFSAEEGFYNCVNLGSGIKNISSKIKHQFISNSKDLVKCWAGSLKFKAEASFCSCSWWEGQSHKFSRLSLLVLVIKAAVADRSDRQRPRSSFSLYSFHSPLSNEENMDEPKFATWLNYSWRYYSKLSVQTTSTLKKF